MRSRELAERNKREKALRAQVRVSRKFNEPLKMFIETKYPDIYNEYTQLYERLDSENPGRRSLTKTHDFKCWLSANSSQKTMPTTGQMLVPQLLLEPCVPPTGQKDNVCATIPTGQEDNACVDILTRALQETFGEAVQPETVQPEAVQPEAVQPEAEQFVQEDNDGIENILNELMENPFLRDFLERADVNLNEDEGIELNHYDEIAMDIEPFDFELEVESYDF